MKVALFIIDSLKTECNAFFKLIWKPFVIYLKEVLVVFQKNNKTKKIFFFI